MRRAFVGFGPLLVIVACLLGLWTTAPDLGWALAGPAQDLGQPTDPARLRTNLHATVHGRAGPTGSATYRGEDRPLVVLEDAPVVVLARPGSHPTGLIDATGRLVRADRMVPPIVNLLQGQGDWEKLASLKKVRLDQLYVLVEGVEPGLAGAAVGWTALFLAILVFNVWRLLRMRRRAAEASP